MNALALLQHPLNLLPLPTLPTEVIEEVIDQASDDSQSLRHLSRLCKSLLTRARFNLFSRIRIRNVEHMESFRVFLDLHPWVLPLVQNVTLSVDNPYDYPKRHIPLLDTFPSYLFSRLPNLRTWMMRATIESDIPVLSFHTSTLTCYRAHGRHIHTLELVGIRFPDISHFTRLVSAFINLRRLTCSDILVRKELQTPLLDSEMIRKLSKPLKIGHLSVNMSVDIRLVEYLLRASGATLNSFAMAIPEREQNTKELKNYFERLEEWIRIGQLPMLSSITLALHFGWEHSKFCRAYRPGRLIKPIQWATKLLEHCRGRKHLSDVRVQFKSPTILALGYPLSPDVPGSSLEACAALEELLLTFPASNIQFQFNRYEAGRVEFWSMVVKSAFPRLDERGCLIFPKTSTWSSDLCGRDNRVTSIVASPDSKWIATGSFDGTIIIWNAEGGTIMYEWLAHWSCVEALSFSPDGLQIVSAGRRGGEKVVIWDFGDGVHKLAALVYVEEKASKETAVFSCSWSPDGTLVASACRAGSVRVWDALTFQPRNLLPVLAGNEKATIHPRSLHWSFDSRYLVWSYTISKGTGQDYDEFAIWSPYIVEPPKRFPSHPTRHVNFSIEKVSFDHESSRIATALAWKRFTSDIVRGGSEGVAGVAGTSDEHSGCVLIWDIESGTKLAVLKHNSGKVEATSFSPNGRYLLSIDGENLKIWDTDSWQITASLEGALSGACFFPDGMYVATLFNGGEEDIYSVQLWRLGETFPTAMFTEHTWWITHVAFSPNGEFLASGDDDGIVYIRRLSDFVGHWPRSTYTSCASDVDGGIDM